MGSSYDSTEGMAGAPIADIAVPGAPIADIADDLPGEAAAGTTTPGG